MALLPDRATLRKRFLAEWPQIVRIVIAAVVSWEVCQLIDTSAVPIFAVVAPLVAMRDQPFSALNVSFDRIIGVVVGVVLGVVVVRVFGSTLLSVVVVLSVGLLSGVVLRIGPVLNIQVALDGPARVHQHRPGHLRGHAALGDAHRGRCDGRALAVPLPAGRRRSSTASSCTGSASG